MRAAAALPALFSSMKEMVELTSSSSTIPRKSYQSGGCPCSIEERHHEAAAWNSLPSRTLAPSTERQSPANLNRLKHWQCTWGLGKQPSTISLTYAASQKHTPLPAVFAGARTPTRDRTAESSQTHPTVGQSNGHDSSSLHDPGQGIPHEAQELENLVLLHSAYHVTRAQSTCDVQAAAAFPLNLFPSKQDPHAPSDSLRP